MIKIVSYNLNGIRAAMRKGLVDWLADNDFDVVGFQEVKAMREQVDLQPFEDLGYEVYWHAAERKGYSGVALLSKQRPDQVVEGCGIEKYDKEGRVIRADFGDWTLLNCYFPSGTSGDERQAFKYDFLDDFKAWIEALRKERPNLIIQGDYNIAHTEMDIHNPKSNKNTSGFLPEERAWLSEWWASGFVDSFRSQHPEQEKYSWWSYRAASRKRNKGWRIDYQAVATPLADRIEESDLLNDAVHSDHCPCYLALK